MSTSGAWFKSLPTLVELMEPVILPMSDPRFTFMPEPLRREDDDVGTEPLEAAAVLSRIAEIGYEPTGGESQAWQGVCIMSPMHLSAWRPYPMEQSVLGQTGDLGSA